MSGLLEKDPELAGIVDKVSKRNLLDPTNPAPLNVDLGSGKATRLALEIRNADAGLIDLAISSDEVWIEPEQTRLTLVGGESGECVFLAKPIGESEFANLLFSWEGNEQTLCQSVMVQRPQPAAAAPDKAKQEPGKPVDTSLSQEEKADAVKKLTNFIKGCAPDKFIDYDEEQQIFRKGGALELAITETESILNRLCSEGNWTRQTRLTDKLTAMLNEATKDDGVIDQQEYEHVVNFAVKRLMPRRDADEHCITLILNNAWKSKETMLNKWFTKKRKQYGL